MVHVSLITSLYRTEQHLPTYIGHARDVLAQVREAGITMEIIAVANEATEGERTLLDGFAAEDSAFKVLYVPRESLYASWNRGVEQAQGEALGFWNVDDVRTAAGIMEGYHQIKAGHQVVYFAYTVIRTGGRRLFRQQQPRQRSYHAIEYDPQAHRRQMKCGPFFMFSPAFYARVGAFDGRFRLVGDFEWCARATDYAHDGDFYPANIIGGYFILHGGNLTDSGNLLQVAEDNVVHLLRGQYQWLTPVDPELMQKTWAKWAADQTLPTEIEQQLWGDGAKERAEQYWQQRHQATQREQINQTIRRVPRALIDKTGLRGSLAKLGIVKPLAPKKL